MTYLLNTVRDPALRRALESDYRELQQALKQGLHKCSLVLAGGIAEGVLINYLQVIGYSHPPKGKDPKKMQFGELVEACKLEGALSEETASLCTVLQLDRNLVHPGRVAREEDWPDASRADLAAKAMQRVLGDVAGRIRKRPEWAADAVIDFADDWSVQKVAIERRIRKLSASDVEQLIVRVLPDRFIEALSNHNPSDDEDAEWYLFCDACSTCFDLGLEAASSGARTEAARRLLQELDSCGPEADEWLSLFFRTELLASLDTEERQDLVGHLMAVVRQFPNSRPHVPMDGVGSYLGERDVRAFVEGLSRSCLSANEYMAAYAKSTLTAEVRNMSDERQSSARSSIEALIDECEKKREGDMAARLVALRCEMWPVLDEDIPR